MRKLSVKQELIDLEIGMDKIMGETHKVTDFISLTYGEPFQWTAPSIKKEAQLALDANQTKYPPTAGLISLREALVRRYQQLYQVDYQVSEFQITTGATQGLSMTLMSILSPQDEVICLTPCFVLYQPTIEMFGGTFIDYDTSRFEFQIDKQSLREMIHEKTRAILITSPNNPTGVALNKASLEILVEIALENELYLISDDIYDQIVFKPIDHLIAYQQARKHIVSIQSFSKSHSMTGWRLGWVVGDIDFIKHLNQTASILASGVSTFTQVAGVRALEEDSNDLVVTFKAHCDYMCSRLDAMGLTYVYPDGAFYVFPSIATTGKTSWDFAYEALHQYKVGVIPGIDFSKDCDLFIRLSFVCSMEDLIEGMNRLETYVNYLNKEKI